LAASREWCEKENNAKKGERAEQKESCPRPPLRVFFPRKLETNPLITLKMCRADVVSEIEAIASLMGRRWIADGHRNVDAPP